MLARIGRRRYKFSKGTISFPLSEPVPLKLIERMARLRAKEVAERMNSNVSR